MLAGLVGSASAQVTSLSDEEYAYVTMDLQGILNLTMTTDPNVNFTFKSIQDYKNGITKFNATKLEVDATVAWDLFAYAKDDLWTSVETYSSTGTPLLPAEILQMQSTNDNASSTPIVDANFDNFVSLRGPSLSGVSNGLPDPVKTQFLAGKVGTSLGESYSPGTASSNPSTHQFRIDYRLHPGIPATFSTNTVLNGGTLPSPGFAQAGYYYLEVVYALVEDL